jgi:armadillo repeat-containing protein 8
MEDGLVARLVQLHNTQDPDLRLNSLWAVKNLLRKTTPETKQQVMSQLGWPDLSGWDFLRFDG